jgi:hypothetical protein
MKKSRKLACHMVNSNMAIGSLPTLQISLGIVALFEKIYNGERTFTVVSNIGEVYITVFSMRSIIWKVCRSPTLCRYLETILDSRVVLSLSQDGAFANPFVRVCLQTKFVKSANMIFFSKMQNVYQKRKFYADIESVEKAAKNIIRKMLSPKNRQKNWVFDSYFRMQKFSAYAFFWWFFKKYFVYFGTFCLL